jgi:hypothetical protein
MQTVHEALQAQHSAQRNALQSMLNNACSIVTIACDAYEDDDSSTVRNVTHNVSLAVFCAMRNALAQNASAHTTMYAVLQVLTAQHKKLLAQHLHMRTHSATRNACAHIVLALQCAKLQLQAYYKAL